MPELLKFMTVSFMTVSLIVLAAPAACAVADEISEAQPEPASCSLVFQTEAEAAAHCEKDSYAIPVKDIWNNMIVGYSCFCPGHTPIDPRHTVSAEP